MTFTRFFATTVLSIWIAGCSSEAPLDQGGTQTGASDGAGGGGTSSSGGGTSSSGGGGTSSSGGGGGASSSGAGGQVAPGGSWFWRTAGSAYVSHVAAAPDGGVVFAGYFPDPIDFGGGTIEGTALVAFDATGAFRWQIDTGTVTVHSIQITEAGQTAITGLGGVYGEFQMPTLAPFVASIAPEGDIDWLRWAACDGGYSLGGGSVTKDGSVTVFGGVFGTIDWGTPATGQGDTWVAAFSPSGDLDWVKTHDIDIVEAVAAVDGGGAVLTGWANLSDTLVCGADALPLGKEAAFALKLDAQGDCEAARVYDDQTSALYIALADDGRIAIAGGRDTNTASAYDPFVMVLDAALEPIWTASPSAPGTTEAVGVGFMPDGGVALGGSFHKKLTFGGQDYPIVGAGAFVVRYDGSGEPLDAEIIEAPEIAPQAFAVGSSGRRVASGVVSGKAQYSFGSSTGSPAIQSGFVVSFAP
jgi:hypothetical protein